MPNGNRTCDLERQSPVWSSMFLQFFLVDGEARFQVIRQGSRMVQGACVQPEAFGRVTPCSSDGPLEKISAQTLANEFGHQAELDQFNFAFDPSIQLGKAGRDAIRHQNVNLDPGIVKDSRKL